MYVCAVDKLMSEIMWDELLYVDATPLSPPPSLALSPIQPFMLFLLHQLPEDSQTMSVNTSHYSQGYSYAHSSFPNGSIISDNPYKKNRASKASQEWERGYKSGFRMATIKAKKGLPVVC